MNWINKSRRKDKRGQPRRRVKPFWQHSMFFAAVFIFIAGGIGSSVWWIWDSDWLLQEVKRAKSSFISRAAEEGFIVRKILVEGRVETSRHDLLSALRLENGTPILGFNTDLARNRVESLPWVQKAVIERQLPDVINLFLLERRPLALWQRNGSKSLIDMGGDLIPLGDISAFDKLVVVIGKDAPARAAKLFKVLATKPQLASLVTAAVRVGGRRWNLHLNNQTEILLPEKGAEVAWAHLADLYKKHDLFFDNLKAIDLRLADRMIISRVNNRGGKGRKDELPKTRLKSADNPRKMLKRKLAPRYRSTSIQDRET